MAKWSEGFKAGGFVKTTTSAIDNRLEGEFYLTNKKLEGEYSRSPSEMVKEFMSVTGQTPDPILQFLLVEEEFEEFCEATPGTVEELKELADLVYVLYGFAEARGYDLTEALVRVHQNNVGRCIQPDGTVHRREDGKIIKNPDYPKVQLEDLI